MSIIAFIAVLITGRYPRGFSTSTSGSCIGRGGLRSTPTARRHGPLRAFYLGEAPDSPAHLRVDYRQHLSRGLVPVRWCLLRYRTYTKWGWRVPSALGVLVSAGLSSTTSLLVTLKHGA